MQDIIRIREKDNAAAPWPAAGGNWEGTAYVRELPVPGKRVEAWAARFGDMVLGKQEGVL